MCWKVPNQMPVDYLQDAKGLNFTLCKCWSENLIECNLCRCSMLRPLIIVSFLFNAFWISDFIFQSYKGTRSDFSLSATNVCSCCRYRYTFKWICNVAFTFCTCFDKRKVSFCLITAGVEAVKGTQSLCEPARQRITWDVPKRPPYRELTLQCR